MSQGSLGLSCFIENDTTPFLVQVTAPIGMIIYDLKELIKEKGKNGVLSSVDAKDLTLWKVRYL
jgi:Crinkler effector protein N-terminal domain